MQQLRTRIAGFVPLALVAALFVGCGTTKWSDSPRTATEMLLISDAVDRAVSEIDFSVLAEKKVYLDTRFIVTTLDQNYVVSTMRQHMLASGIIIMDKPDEATYVVEVRTGSLGTNRQDLLFGLPSTTLPTAGMLPTGAASIPEIALVKRTNQQAVCKLAVFAYDRISGRPVWQSGNRKVASRAKDIWVMGAGPFQKGTIYDGGTSFAGERLSVPLAKKQKNQPQPEVSVAENKRFDAEEEKVSAGDDSNKVSNAGYLAPVSKSDPAAAPVPAATPPAGGSPPATPAAKPVPTTPPKAAYTPPVVTPPVVPPPPLVGTGPQGNLVPQTIVQPTANPAAATSGAIQTYNWAKDFMDQRKAQ